MSPMRKRAAVRTGRSRAKAPKLSAQDRVILFCVATGIDHAAAGILAGAMQSMAVRGFMEHDCESGAYVLTDSGRATLTMILDHEESRVGRMLCSAVLVM